MELQGLINSAYYNYSTIPGNPRIYFGTAGSTRELGLVPVEPLSALSLYILRRASRAFADGF